MNRYHIAIDKPLPRESKILKPLLRKLKRKKISDEKGSQDSSAYIASVNAVRDTIRRDSSPSSQIQGEIGLLGVVQGNTGMGMSGITGALGPTGASLRVQGSDEGVGFQIRASDPANRAGFFHTGDSIETPPVPVSQFFTLTGPNGFRIMIPLRRFNFEVTTDQLNYNRSFFTMRLTTNQANGMQEDINAGRERLGLSRDESL